MGYSLQVFGCNGSLRILHLKSVLNAGHESPKKADIFSLGLFFLSILKKKITIQFF